MFNHIMVPVNLAEKENLDRAITVACDLGLRHAAQVTLVSVSGGLSAPVSHSTKEYGRKLDKFADEVSQKHGVKIATLNIPSPDPSVEVDTHLRHAIDTLGADLVVIASHMPGWTEYFVSSHGGKLASHAPVSVMVVRDQRKPKG